jgi:hypothetical protein
LSDRVAILLVLDGLIVLELVPKFNVDLFQLSDDECLNLFAIVAKIEKRLPRSVDAFLLLRGCAKVVDAV